MNPENRVQETTRCSKLQVRRMASMEEGSSAAPVYAPVPLRTALTVNLGNGLHGTMVYTRSDNSFTFLQTSLSPPASARQNEYEEEKRGLHLIKLLHSCAEVVTEGETDLVNKGLREIFHLASDDSEEPMQRLASSFADALAARMVQPWLQNRITVPAQEAAAARRQFAAMCPFLRISGAVANHAIFDAVAVQPGMVVHVIDLGGADLDQWLQLLRLFAARSPNLRVRLTVVNEQEEFLSDAAKLLTKEAQRLRVGFQFHPFRLNIDRLLTLDAFGVSSGEALVVVSTLQLHRLLADEFAQVASPPHDRKGKKIQVHEAQPHQQTRTRADTFLHDLRRFSPKLVVVTEQEADHNSADFTGRFKNALVYYGALIDALEESVPARGSAAERASVERCLLREEIRDIVAHDGGLRKERHEKLERWAARMDAAGFTPAPMRRGGMAQAAMLAQDLLPGGAYRVSRMNDACLFIYRNAIPMFSVSTWRTV